MGDLTKHISRHEVACSCGCGFDVADIELVEQIEDCITHFEQSRGVRLFVSFGSWCRCAEHNATLPGSSSISQHLLGRAVDFSIVGVHPYEVTNWLEQKYPDSHGIGRYKTFTHFDIRPNKARWG